MADEQELDEQELIAILERVHGAPLHEVFHDLIFRPLKLTRTLLPGSPGAEGIAPTPAAFWAGDHRLDTKPGPLRSFLHLYSTLDEILRFMGALLHGGLFGKPETAHLISAHFNPLAFSLSLRPVGPGWPIEYGPAVRAHAT